MTQVQTVTTTRTFVVDAAGVCTAMIRRSVSMPEALYFQAVQPASYAVLFGRESAQASRCMRPMSAPA